MVFAPAKHVICGSQKRIDDETKKKQFTKFKQFTKYLINLAR